MLGNSRNTRYPVNQGMAQVAATLPSIVLDAVRRVAFLFLTSTEEFPSQEVLIHFQDDGNNKGCSIRLYFAAQRGVAFPQPGLRWEEAKGKK